MEAPPINLWPTIRNIQMNTEKFKMFQFTSRFPFLKVRQNLQRDIGHCSFHLNVPSYKLHLQIDICGNHSLHNLAHLHYLLLWVKLYFVQLDRDDPA